MKFFFTLPFWRRTISVCRIGRDEAKKAILFFALSGMYTVSAQYNQWVWIKGDSVMPTALRGVYGSMNIADNKNQPGERYESCEWTDKQGNFWLFSGSGLMSNDLWKYEPSTNMWTWVHGDTINATASYGTKGVASLNNHPPPKGFGAATWVDSSGIFWIFGGSSITTSIKRNDLWKYNPLSTSNTIDQWTWMKGDSVANQPGVYGVKGVPADENTPGARDETACSWTDNSDNLWLFGGKSYNSSDLLNDLWKYSLSTNQWTWMSGDSSGNKPGVYGTKGTSDMNTIPGGRQCFSNWKDKNGDLWLFGGGTSAQSYNDMWKYSIASNEWTWMSGSASPNDTSVYDFLCAESTSNFSGSKNESRSKWVDGCGNFWLYGGSGMGSNTYGDLWMYNPLKNKWKAINGKSTSSFFGIKGVAAENNTPGIRVGALSWKNKEGFWLFGGGSSFVANSTPQKRSGLWKYIPDKPTSIYGYAIAAACTVIFINTSTSNCNEIKSYSWNFGDVDSGINNFSSLENPSHAFSSIGKYDVKLVVTSCTESKDSSIQTIAINSCNKLLVPNIFTPNGDGQNDVFSFTSFGLKSLTCSIFNRWGAEVYTLKDAVDYWSGEGATNGVFYYNSTYVKSDGKEGRQSGYFQLLR